jgi:predicted unusual protein kinase regulating ubiquinone biosynthesis (AarF/ABC1/UbiB family)
MPLHRRTKNIMQLTATTLVGLLLFGGVQGFLPAVVHSCRESKPAHLGLSIREKIECQEEMGNDFSSTITTAESPIARAVEILSIIGGEILYPLVVSLLQNGFPSDWESFWSHGGKVTNAQRIAAAAEKLGPTYVKFCQALASRPDVIPKSLASALEVLQDDMEPFDSAIARDIIRSELEASMDSNDLEQFVKSLGDEPVGAASIGQVYKGYLPGCGDVAVKVKRLGVRELVERDAALLRTLAGWIESIPAYPSSGANRLVATELVEAVEEFFSRIFEELDYRREAENCAEFGSLYSAKERQVEDVQVVVPKLFPQFCTANVLVMQWLEGTKLTDVDLSDHASVKENLEIISIGIACTLSQLLETGVSRRIGKFARDELEVTHLRMSK